MMVISERGRLTHSSDHKLWCAFVSAAHNQGWLQEALTLLRVYLSIMSRPMGSRTVLPGMETLSMVTQPQLPLSELISSSV